MARVKGPCSLRVILTATLAIILTFLPSISLGAPSKCRSPSATSVPAPTTPSEGNPSSTLPLPFSKSRPPATLHLFENLSRYRTSRANSLVLKFKKQQVAMRSGARFAFSPTWFPTEEMTFSYAFRVANDFNFRLTGKLPGVYFGSCRSCYSSGKVYNKGQGSFRPTWQVKDAKGKWAYNGTPFVEPYIYGAHGSYKASRDAQGPDTAAAIGPGGTKAGFHIWPRKDDAFDIRRGEWNTVSIHVKMNDVGRSNGVARVTVNGNTKELRDVSWRTDEKTLIQSVAMECFFGGSSKWHMTPAYEQQIEFRDVVVAPAE